MAASPAKTAGPPPAFVIEALAVLWRHVAGGMRRWIRGSWLYRALLLKGPLADRLAVYPYDAAPRRLDDADALLRGRFRFQGEAVDADNHSIFDFAPPSAEWNEALHGFAWLPPLAAAGGEAARTLATNLVSQWLKRNGRYTEPGWLPHVMGRRLIALFCHGRFILTHSDVMWRSRVFVSLREQSRMLARVAGEAPEGLPRLEAAAALVLSGACLMDSPKRLDVGLTRFEAELARQILPDGGHISRSPENLVEAFRLVVMVMDALAATNLAVPQGLRGAHDRMAPMIRFFRHGDGALALFNGGGEGKARMVSALLSRDDVRGLPFSYARHSGYQRLAVARTLALLDCGPPPPPAFSANAHAGCLAFELSAGPHRIIVNCGTAALVCHRRWQSALRATAAHSTVTVADTSSSLALRDGWVSRLVGARLVHGPAEIETRRVETEKGWTVVANHDGYLHAFGIRHEREVTLSPQGLALTGVDRLLPNDMKRRNAVPFAVRFHVHPDVRVSTAQSGDIILKLPNGEGWRFRASLPVAVEEGVYLGGDTVRRGEQLVLTGTVKNEAAEAGWLFEQIGMSAE